MDEAERLIRAGLQPPATRPAENMVTIIIDGKQQQVPADVGTYMAVSNLASMTQHLIMRLDALHAHLAGRDHARSAGRADCFICQTNSLTPEQIEEIRQQANGSVAVEESKEQESE